MILSNGNVWKKDGKRSICERKLIKDITKRKTVEIVVNNPVEIFQTKTDTPPQKKTTPLDAPI